jgi:hypothetical protein
MATAAAAREGAAAAVGLQRHQSAQQTAEPLKEAAAAAVTAQCWTVFYHPYFRRIAYRFFCRCRERGSRWQAVVVNGWVVHKKKEEEEAGGKSQRPFHYRCFSSLTSNVRRMHCRECSFLLVLSAIRRSLQDGGNSNKSEAALSQWEDEGGMQLSALHHRPPRDKHTQLNH